MTLFKKFFPFFVIFGLVLVFFWKFFFQGLIPIPADIISGMYLPWLDYKWGYVVGVPVKNPLLSDAVSQFWIWRNLAIDLFKSGQSPFWNPYALSGSPLVPVFHSSFFSPFNLFFAVFDKFNSMSLIVILQPLLASLFMYLLLWGYKLSRLSSLFGGLVFGFSGFMLSWLEWGNVGHTLLWLPFFVWVTEKYVVTKKPKYLVFLVFSLGISLSAGHPQTFFYCFCLWFLYFVWRLWKNSGWRAIFLPLVISGVFVLCFSFLIFPAAESFWFSIRKVENYISRYNFGFFPPLHLITFLAPDFFGNPSTGNWWGRGFNYQEQVGYFGLIPLALSFFAFFLKKKDLSFWKIIFCFSFLSAFKYPFGWLIYQFKIPLLSTASASRILMITAFAGAVLAAFSFEEMNGGKSDLKSSLKTLWILVVAYFGYAIAAVYSFLLVSNELKTGLYSGPSEKMLSLCLNQMITALRNLVLPSLFLFLFLGLFFGLRRFKRYAFYRLCFSLTIFFLTALELFRYGWKYNQFVKRELYFPETPLTNYLQNIFACERVERERGEIMPPNMWVPYGLYSASGYDPIYPSNYARFLSLLDGNDFTKDKITRYGEIENYRSSFFDFLGIKYVTVIKRDTQDIVSKKGRPSYKFNIEKFKPVADFESVAVLENEKVFPRAFLVEKVDFSENDQEVIQKMKKNAERLAEMAFVTSLDKISEETFASEIKSKIKKVKIDSYRSGEVILSAESDSQSFLVLTDNFFPGWKALVDSQKTQIYRTDLSFRGILLPKGSHKISFVYDPLSYRIGFMLSSLSSSLLVAVVVRKDSKRKI